jgi:hypothetical protein
VIAVFGTTEDVRRQAIETLKSRDGRGVLDLVIRLLREPIKFTAKPHEGPGSVGVIYIEGKDVNLERIYDAPAPAVGLPTPQAIQTYFLRIEMATNNANRRFADDLMALTTTNASIVVTNKNALAALKGLTAKDFGFDQNAWMAWWTDRQGYALKAATTTQTAQKMTITQFVDPYPSCSCFAAGTPVQTIDGLRPIETLKVGDRVLTQDTTTGVLSYQPALAVFHNPPADTLRVRIGGESIVATGIHRFWKAGHGWTMARDLKVGDPIRLVGGIAKVELVEPDKLQPVFNLEVARGTDFFVGQSGALVHDNSLVQTVANPFDAAPDLAH